MSSRSGDNDWTIIPTANAVEARADSEPHGEELPIGSVVGEFRIVSLIGQGGFGIVYLAEDESLDRMVALKEYMPSDLATRGEDDKTVRIRSQRHEETFAVGLRSFINEARLLAQFDHPSLVKVHRFFTANGTAYMVMPYYKGDTVKHTLRSRAAPPDEAWTRRFLLQILDALEIIHAANCYHRDISPDNILILTDGTPLLLDFGAARRVIGDTTRGLTVILKAGYAPIEQYAEDPHMKQGAWTDVYALAAVAHFAITGEAPVAAVARVVNDRVVPLAQRLKDGYSAGFLQALDAALAVIPSDRPQTVAEFRRMLEASAATATTPLTTVRGSDNAISHGDSPEREVRRATTSATAAASSGQRHPAQPSLERSGAKQGRAVLRQPSRHRRVAAAGALAVLALLAWWALRTGGEHVPPSAAEQQTKSDAAPRQESGAPTAETDPQSLAHRQSPAPQARPVERPVTKAPITETPKSPRAPPESERLANAPRASSDSDQITSVRPPVAEPKSKPALEHKPGKSTSDTPTARQNAEGRAQVPSAASPPSKGASSNSLPAEPSKLRPGQTVMRAEPEAARVQTPAAPEKADRYTEKSAPHVAAELPKSKAPSSAVSTSRAELPALKIGDAWVYQTENVMTGEKHKPVTQRVTAITSDKMVVQIGSTTRTYDRELNLMEVRRGESVIATHTPAMKYFKFPMEVGSHWNASFTSTRSEGARTTRWQWTANVEGKEAVTVPAGTFDTFKIKIDGYYNGSENTRSWNGRRTETLWYAPAVKRHIKAEWTETAPGYHHSERDELVAFRPAN